MPLFKACVLPNTVMAKLSYSLPKRYTAILAPQYDQAATFIYGGLTQHGDVTGNFCADINGNGQGARSDRDGEHSIAPVFGFMCDTGEHEIAEEDTPIVRLGAQVLAKDRIGFGKYRGGLGYEQVATVRRSNYWGFMTGCEGSKFCSTQGLFGGYSSPAYQLCKIKGVNIFKELKSNPAAVTFDILSLMNNQSLPGTYSVNGTGMTFELCNEGELYMNRQGAGGGYGDVLERDPELVMKDIAEDLMSAAVAQSVYHVVFDEVTLTLDRTATDAARAAERKARIARGKPFDEFCAAWVTPEPPEHIPYFGSWDDPAEIYAGVPGARIKTSALQQTGVMMPDPKDVRIAALEAEVAALRAAA
jgi:acetone carboxylase, alpha subunit